MAADTAFMTQYMGKGGKKPPGLAEVMRAAARRQGLSKRRADAEAATAKTAKK